MKYVVSWTNRDTATTEADVKRLLTVFSKWTPSEGSTFHQFLGRLDNNGGFAVIETESPMDILRDVSKFEPWLRYEVIPVVDVQDLAGANDEGLNFRESIS
ncbi:MAG TPA: DUF3303 family protein [Acidimicrobiales bacterium]|jgi:hypothetical protein|nr:DUF3303 family protein [Acidimicrobiales bacterium]